MALKQQANLSDTTTDGEDALITIRGFLNIVALIQRVESDAEKIALNCLLLLVITGFRSIEAFNLNLLTVYLKMLLPPLKKSAPQKDQSKPLLWWQGMPCCIR